MTYIVLRVLGAEPGLFEFVLSSWLAGVSTALKYFLMTNGLTVYNRLRCISNLNEVTENQRRGNVPIADTANAKQKGKAELKRLHRVQNGSEIRNEPN